MASNKKNKTIEVRNFERDSKHSTYESAELRLVELKQDPFTNAKIRLRRDGYRVMVQKGMKNIPAPKDKLEVIPDVPSLDNL